MAQGRLRDAHLGRGAREAALPGDGQEGDQVIDVLTRHPGIPLMNTGSNITMFTREYSRERMRLGLVLREHPGVHNRYPRQITRIPFILARWASATSRTTTRAARSADR